MSRIVEVFNSLTNVQKSLATAIVSIILFSVTAGGAYSFFSTGKVSLSNLAITSGSSNLPTADSGGEDPSHPKTESCLLNGSMHSKAAAEAWEKRRPLAVMVENHQESRPQSGLSSADVIYEAVAEGGITRFMAIFYCTSLADTQVGPVRSARTYFLDWLSEYDALYAHVGGANTPGPANALGQIIKYGTKDLNQFSIGFPTFWRDYQRLGHPVATEHTMYSTTQKLWKIGEQRGWTNIDEDTEKEWKTSFVPWKFKDDASGGTTAKVDVSFWGNQPNYDVSWKYDNACNCYKRFNGGSEHNDLNTNKQLEAKNLVVQLETESNANDGYENNAHLLYGTTGTGKALIFQDGKVIEGKWAKSSRLARTKYTDAAGKEIQFNKGLIWIQTVPVGSKVSY
jgi:hypothetical protein